jgi:F-type H+-transporting ATPase subunit delta
MPRVSASRRFAEAAFEIATRDGTVESWRHDLGTACEVASDVEVARAGDSPAVPFALRRKAVEQLLSSRVSALAVNLALVLASRGRFYLLPDVSASFDDLYRRSKGIVGATVTTPLPLPADEREALQKRVEEIAGAQVELYTETDPALIGGLCVRIGDYQIDASVATRLSRLRRKLVQGASPTS